MDPRSTTSPIATSPRKGVRSVQAEIAVCLPGQPQVRREILRVSGGSRTYTLRPDDSRAGVTLHLADDHFHAVLAGPERAELEVHWDLQDDHACPLALWATSRGLDVEASLWNAFGDLVVPDVTARGLHAPDIQLPPGRYLLTAIVTGQASLVIGAGCVPAVALPTDSAKRNAG